MKRLLLILVLAFSTLSLSAQDTLRFMTYNVLRYGSNNQFCDVSCKDQQLERIIDYTNPDVLCVQEIIENEVYATRILNNVLNSDGSDRFERVTMVEQTNSSITNMLFYDKNKLTFDAIDVLNTSPRSTQIYTFYYNDANLAAGDTTFFRIVAVHLKAGQSNSDEQDRTTQVNAIMNHFVAEPTITNAFIMGDFNIYESTEAAYGAMLNPTSAIIGFNDPINRPGDWTSSSFSDIHTQSTRTDQESDGGSSGGSDNRFDFILISDVVETGTEGIEYVNGTYTTVGQDGSFYNGTVTSSTAVPSTVAAALYNMSDHLPVYADFAFTDVTPVSRTETQSLAELRLLGNPVNDELRVLADISGVKSLSFSVMDYTGRKLMTEGFTQSGELYRMDVSHLSAGIYILNVRTESGATRSVRFIKS